MSIVCLMLGWYAANLRTYRSERETIESLPVGEFGYVATLYGDGYLTCGMGVVGTARQTWHGPTWLEPPLEYFDSPILYRTDELFIYSSTFGDEALEMLAGLRYLQKIELSGTAVTESGARRLREMFPQATVVYEPRKHERLQEDLSASTADAVN